MLKYVSKMSSKNYEEESSVERTDVIIVGAGLSGLTSAIKILQKEPTLNIKILEAKGHLGGKIESSKIGEMGGCCFTEDQYHIHYLMRYLDLPLYPHQQVSPHLARCWDLDHGPTSYLARFELSRYLYELDCKVYQYKQGKFSFQAKSISMEKHICRSLWFNKSRNFMRNLVLIVAGIDSKNVTHTEFMSICYTCINVTYLLDLWFNWSRELYEISSADLIEALRNKIPEVTIEFQCKVHEVRQSIHSVDVIEANRNIHQADVVILAIPFNNIQKIIMDHPIPVELRDQSTDILRMTSFLALYNDGHWRNVGYSGSFYQTEPFIVGHEYRAQSYAGFMVHKNGMEHIVRLIVLKALAKYFGESMLMPLKYEQRTYDLSTMAHAPMTTPQNRIIWSSSAAAATCFRGCLGGAVQSGLRAALNTLLLLRPQMVSWQDLAEVQNCESISKRTASLPRVWLSTLNIYNVTFYGIFSVGLIAMLRYINTSDIKALW